MGEDFIEFAGGTWDADKLRSATSAAGCALWCWNVRTDEIQLDERARALWWVAEGEAVSFAKLSERIHPVDLDRVQASFDATRKTAGPYEIDFRIRRGNEVRWISARGQGGDAGIVDDTVFAVFMDVTPRKAAEEAKELLAGEMSHRVKNLLAVASSLTRIAARASANTSEMTEDLTQRLHGLARAHDLVGPEPGHEESGALLGELLSALLSPYDYVADGRGRIHINAPLLRIGPAASTSLALIAHELATNSVKHGALSSPHGRLDIACSKEGGQLVLSWTETGGPAVAEPPVSRGYGGKLVSRTVAGQLGGTVHFEWPPEGLVATLRMDACRLSV